VKYQFHLSAFHRRGLALLAGAFAITALSACMDSSEPTGTELAVGAVVGVAPTISQQPQSVQPLVGDQFILAIGANGTAPFQYRWQICPDNINCANIPNATSQLYFRVAHSGDTDYTFRCIVSNAYGSATSVKVSSSPSPIIVQAETGILTGAVIAHSIPEWTGFGYVVFPHISGDNIVLKPAPKSAGTYTLGFRYANNHPNTLKIEVNGVVVQPSLSFPYHGGLFWWRQGQFNVNLKAGVNTVKATTVALGGPYLDALYVY
jgi:hypothetical protein